MFRRRHMHSSECCHYVKSRLYYALKQTIECDHVQLILIAAAVQGWNDNDKTDMFGFKRCLIKTIIMCIQVFKQTIILERIKTFVEFLKNKSQNMKF